MRSSAHAIPTTVGRARPARGPGAPTDRAQRARSGGRLTHTSRHQQLSVRLSMFLVAVCAAFLLIGGAADAGAPPPPTTEYVVESGDTLWAIAGDLVDTGEDVRVMVSAIKTLSGLDSSTLHPGQVLVVPG